MEPVWHAMTDPAGDAAGMLAARLKDARRAAKMWSKHKHTPLLINNCKFIIRLLDLLEEHRCQSTGESLLRSLCKENLLRLLKARAAYWKQRGKFRAVKEGDENTNSTMPGPHTG